MNLLDFMKKNIHVIILVTYAYILYNHIDDKDTVTMIGFTVITAFTLLQSKKVVEGQAPTTVATATATISAGALSTITVGSGGAGYNQQTTVVITKNTSQSAVPTEIAKATATVSGGKITAVTLDSTVKGKGYTMVPTITFVQGVVATTGDDKTTAENIKKVITSKEYKEAERAKKRILSDLKNAPAAANDKKAAVVPIQQVLQKDALIKVHKGAPRMGTYDGLCLSGLTTKTNYHLVDNDKVHSYMGVQYPPEEVSTEDDVLDGPAIDGDDDSPHKLSMFANNMTSINCCGDSPYVSSSGCICMTKKQKQFIQNRGLYSTNDEEDEEDEDEDEEDEIQISNDKSPGQDKMALTKSNKAPTNKQETFDYKDIVSGK